WGYKKNGQGVAEFKFRKKLNGYTGSKRPVVLGKKWSAGQQGGIEVIQYLSGHDRTQTFICEKLTQRVIGRLVPGVIQRCKNNWGARGHLKAVYRALLTSPAFWNPKLMGSQIKTPFKASIEMARRSHIKPKNPVALNAVLQFANSQGQTVTQIAPPTGYAEERTKWLSNSYVIHSQKAAYALSDFRGKKKAVSSKEKLAPMNWEVSHQEFITTDDEKSIKNILGQMGFQYQTGGKEVVFNLSYQDVADYGMSPEVTRGDSEDRPVRSILSLIYGSLGFLVE
ncbi:MAG: DUF1800 family protein, partial [Pseudomonadota bacterium]